MDLPVRSKRSVTLTFALSRAVVRRMPLGSASIAALAAVFSAFLALARALIGLALAFTGTSELAFSFAFPSVSALAFAFTTPLAFTFLPVLTRGLVVIAAVSIVIIPRLISLFEGLITVASVLRGITVKGLRPWV